MVDLATLANISNVGETVTSVAGNWTYLIAGIVLLIAAFIVIYFVKNLVANAIGGIIALLVAKFIFGVAIPLNGLTIVVTIFGGLGGVAALFLAAFFGWI